MWFWFGVSKDVYSVSRETMPQCEIRRRESDIFELWNLLKIG